MNRLLFLMLSLALATSALAAPAPQSSSGTGTKSHMKKKTTTNSDIAKDLQEMKQALDAQQQQIQALQQQLQQRDQAVQQLQQRLDQGQTTATEAQTKADAAASQANQQAQAVSALRSDVNDMKQNVSNTALTLQETQKAISESPLALHFKGITITPGGFLAAETVWRQRGLGADINTPFNAVPLPGSSQTALPEFFGSGRQSRVSMLAEGKLKDVELTGYVEADFLSAGVTSNNNQSNSYTMRQRQVWGQAALNNGLSFTGGQMWSLVTETKNGVDNRSEALPGTIDPQYTVGFSWARQYGFRVAKNFNNKFWLAASVENPQTTFTAHGASSNFLIGTTGNGGGLYDSLANYSFNRTPDFVFKAVAQPGFGHYEVFAIVSDFRDRVFPNATASTPTAAGAFNDSRAGGGIGANARISLHKKVDLGVHFLGGNGVGRYGTSGLPDATIRPDGTLALIRSYQALGTLEFHTKQWDWYFNGGGEYAGRTAYLSSSGKGVGYGSPFFVNTSCFDEPVPGSGGFAPGSLGSSCTGDTRAVIEGTAGFWYRFYNGPKGKLQFGTQYSYVTRNTWSGVGGDPHGIENMFLTSFRYYLP
jgi:hypothetical protein